MRFHSNLKEVFATYQYPTLNDNISQSVVLLGAAGRSWILLHYGHWVDHLSLQGVLFLEIFLDPLLLCDIDSYYNFIRPFTPSLEFKSLYHTECDHRLFCPHHLVQIDVQIVRNFNHSRRRIQHLLSDSEQYSICSTYHPRFDAIRNGRSWIMMIYFMSAKIKDCIFAFRD